MSNKLQVKDLITIGVFALIYIIGMFTIGMIGVVPILFLIYPTILGIFMGVLTMLFMAKVQKPWALFIFGMITPIVMVAMGHTYVVLLHAFVVVLIAEMVRRKGNYKSFKANIYANGIFNLWICGSLMQMLLVKDQYLELTEPMMGEAYANALERLINLPNMGLVYLGALIGGVLGGYLGYKMLNKHFIKAGIVK